MTDSVNASAEQVLRTEVRHALDRARDAAAMDVTLHGEQDLQHLVNLIRQLGSNPLLAQQLQGEGKRLVVHIAPGRYGDGSAASCGCQGATAGGGANTDAAAGAVTAQRSDPLDGLVGLGRLQALGMPSGDLVLAADAVLTPSARDWLRTHKVRVKRSTS